MRSISSDKVGGVWSGLHHGKTGSDTCRVVMDPEFESNFSENNMLNFLFLE